MEEDKVKGYFKTLILTLICLAILIPFASEFPDGLEKVAETLGIEENEPLWKGLMPDYQLPIIETPYISTIAAGIFGVILVFCTTFILGITISKSKREK
ncbi:MAG: PDGLE domain-containing protein [Candidatus Bathyarchaeia archaeon]